eukprot:CAMPEP_0179024140 /NCGR_PEP_ID=MMETSP0796-20121207/7302_1 /TAXON_ID=73915 /ORGANISM="Pyrodinium bahamense, Strain pbaha01" /LENGTH=162 /DNA_ID=CAMNT_0020720093 /DNA_START=415 /DNA_END=903 /DNA_ORIENTATION=+
MTAASANTKSAAITEAATGIGAPPLMPVTFDQKVITPKPPKPWQHSSQQVVPSRFDVGTQPPARTHPQLQSEVLWMQQTSQQVDPSGTSQPPVFTQLQSQTGVVQHAFQQEVPSYVPQPNGPWIQPQSQARPVKRLRKTEPCEQHDPQVVQSPELSMHRAAV